MNFLTIILILAAIGLGIFIVVRTPPKILIYLVIVSVFIAYLGFLAIKVRGEV